MHNSQIFFLDTIYIHIHQIIKDKSDNNQLPSPGANVTMRASHLALQRMYPQSP